MLIKGFAYTGIAHQRKYDPHEGKVIQEPDCLIPPHSLCSLNIICISSINEQEKKEKNMEKVKKNAVHTAHQLCPLELMKR